MVIGCPARSIQAVSNGDRMICAGGKDMQSLGMYYILKCERDVNQMPDTSSLMCCMAITTKGSQFGRHVPMELLRVMPGTRDAKVASPIGLDDRNVYNLNNLRVSLKNHLSCWKPMLWTCKRVSVSSQIGTQMRKVGTISMLRSREHRSLRLRLKVEVLTILSKAMVCISAIGKS